MTPTLGGTIDNNFFNRYDATVRAALNSGSNPWVILDLVRGTFIVLSRCLPKLISIIMPAGTAKSSHKEDRLMLNIPACGRSLLLNTRATQRLS